MPKELPGEILRTWFNEVWGRRNDAAIDQLAAPHAVAHMQGQVVRGLAEFRKLRAQILNAMPDLQVRVHGAVSERDQGAIRWEILGTIGTQSVRFTGMSWVRCEHGLIVEGWDEWNPAEFNRALAAFQGLAPAGSPPVKSRAVGGRSEGG